MLVPASGRGKGRLCKQCGRGYLVARGETQVLRLPAASNAELLRLAVRESHDADPAP